MDIEIDSTVSCQRVFIKPLPCVNRWKFLGHNHQHLDGVLYHLTHEQGTNSVFHSQNKDSKKKAEIPREKREGKLIQSSIFSFKEALILLMLLVLFVSPGQRVFSQSLSGKVFDKESKEPLANTYLFIKNHPEFN